MDNFSIAKKDGCAVQGKERHWWEERDHQFDPLKTFDDFCDVFSAKTLNCRFGIRCIVLTLVLSNLVTFLLLFSTKCLPLMVKTHSNTFNFVSHRSSLALKRQKHSVALRFARVRDRAPLRLPVLKDGQD